MTQESKYAVKLRSDGLWRVSYHEPADEGRRFSWFLLTDEERKELAEALLHPAGGGGVTIAVT